MVKPEWLTDRACKGCGKLFLPYWFDQLYCDVDCRRAAAAKRKKTPRSRILARAYNKRKWEKEKQFEQGALQLGIFRSRGGWFRP
jgi:hypothetical protein